jgi:hypothetical protein
LSATLPPRRNILGEPIERFPPGYSWQTINPFFISVDRQDKVFDSLAELGHGFTLTPERRGSVDLTRVFNRKGQGAHDRWTQLQGKVTIGGVRLHARLERLIDSESFQKLERNPLGPFDSERVQIIRKIIGAYRNKALQQMLQEFPKVEGAFNADRFLRGQGRALSPEQAKSQLRSRGLDTSRF